MRALNLAVFFEHELKAGGNYQQSLNNLLLINKLTSEKIKVTFVTTRKKNIKTLRKFGIQSIFYSPNKFSFFWMKVRQNLPLILYQILRNFEEKNHLERYLGRQKIDLVYFTSQSKLATYLESLNYIFTLFDLCHRDHPEFPEVSSYRVFEQRELAFQKNLARAVAVFVDSELGKNNAVLRYGLDYKRVHVLPFGPSSAVAVTDKAYQKCFIDIKKKYDLDCDYVFYPAQFWAHKNHVYILQGLKILEQDENIIIGAIFAGGDQGNLDYIKKLVINFGLQKRIRFAGFVKNEEMPYLYKQSLALVMPSYFGPTNLPPLEAFSLGVPVLYSDFPGFREQVGDAALLIDLLDPKNLALQLKRLLQDLGLRNNLIRKGQNRLHEITSDADRLNILNKVLQDYQVRRFCWE
jgi:glycosyltransferase involved in cell wall biosynthesis